MRARSAVLASGVVCELREVILRNKPQALLDASPKATVPVLVQPDGSVIDQSLDIMLWALGLNDPLAWLPAASRELPAMMDLIAECDGEFKHHLDRYKYPQRYDDVDGRVHRDEAASWLFKIEVRLERAAFLFGEHQAIADAAIVPFVRQFARTDLEWFEAQPWPRLQAWLQQWTESTLFERIMGKYPPWTPGQPPLLFPDQAAVGRG